MNGYEVYSHYVALKLHFTSKSYDYFKYNGKVGHVTPDSFERRKDKYFFHKLARKLNDDEVLPFLLANFITNENVWTKDLLEEDAMRTFRDWQKRNQSLSYRFKQEFMLLRDEAIADNLDDLFKSKHGEHPIVLVLYMNGVISIETMVILHQLTGMLRHWRQTITDDIIYPKIEHRILSYMPFMSVDLDQMKRIVKSVLTGAEV